MKKCRLCLNVNGRNKRQLDQTLPNSSVTLHTAIKETFDIFLKIKWNCPSSICSRCFNLTFSSYLFKQEIMKNGSELEKMLNEKTIESPQKIAKSPDRKLKFARQLFPTEPEAPPVKLKQKNCNQNQLIFAETLDHENDDMSEIKQEPMDVQDFLSSEEEEEEDTKISKSPASDLIPKVSKEKGLKKGKKMKTSISDKTCKKCGFIASRPINLWQHIDTSQKNCSDLYDPPHNCYICGKRKFMIKSKAIEHFERDHGDYIMKDCPYCVRGNLKSALNYNNHVKTHFEAPKFVCPNCGKGFFRTTDFTVHMRIYDESCIVYCDLCDYKCKSKHSLKHHLHQHLKIGTYACKLCPKTFIKSSRLTEHLFRNHQTTNNKTCYRCVDCDFVFMSRRDHQRHKLHCGNPKNPLSLRRVKYKDLDKNVPVRDVLRDESTQDI